MKRLSCDFQYIDYEYFGFENKFTFKVNKTFSERNNDTQLTDLYRHKSILLRNILKTTTYFLT